MSHVTISGVKAGPFPVLESVLEKWIDVQSKLFHVLSPDNAPWWYNERASVGSFAAAVWLCNGVALEEYVTFKHGKASRALGGGRGDIFFRIGRAEFRAEAKQLWGKLRGHSQRSFLEGGLAVALKDAKRRPSGNERRIGILFLAPNIPLKHRESVDKHIETWINTLRGIEGAACAWAFPSQARGLSEGEQLYPGCALLGRVLDFV